MKRFSVSAFLGGVAFAGSVSSPARAATGVALFAGGWYLTGFLALACIAAGGVAGFMLARRRMSRQGGGGQRTPSSVLTGTDIEADYDRMFDVVAERLEHRRRELRESEYLLRLLMDSLPIAVFYLDADLRYRLSNRTIEEWFGISRDELAGSTLREVVGDDAYWRIAPQIEQAGLGTPVSYEVMMPYSQGGERYIVSNIVPHIDDEGRVQGYFIALDDLTARKKAEDAVVVARDAAEKADAAKTRFLAAASHDLRQPLHAMRLLTGILASRLKSGPERVITDDLLVSLQSMEGMLNALLDISQLESGVLRPDVSDFPVEEILYRIEREFAPQAKEHGLDIRVVPSTAIAHSDLALLERVLANFVSNAIRYTEQGKIVVGCRRGGGKLRFEVWDSGIGIPEDQIRAIFEEYHQVANPARDRSKGLGLGLALVDRLAHTLGHRISCRSIEGRGSVFCVEFPEGAEPDIGKEFPLDGAVGTRLSGQRILVVEDDTVGLNAMQRWLEGQGADVIAAASGEEVAALLEGESFDCDLIITDHRLPNRVTGDDVVRAVHTGIHRRVPAIILTGDSAPEIRANAEASGYGFARKPIDPDILLAEINERLPTTVAAE